MSEITKELAAKLNGREYRNEITAAEARYAKANGLVVVYGASDDLMELRGAVDEEIGVYGGEKILMSRTGLIKNECDCERCPYFPEKTKGAAKIEAVWDSGGYSWTYKTKIPHATFEIVEDGEKYCRGIVFALADVPA